MIDYVKKNRVSKHRNVSNTVAENVKILESVFAIADKLFNQNKEAFNKIYSSFQDLRSII